MSILLYVQVQVIYLGGDPRKCQLRGSEAEKGREVIKPVTNDVNWS